MGKSLAASVQHLVIQAKKSVKGLLDGLWRSHFKGRGIDFDELQPYQPGDPVEDISWTHLSSWNQLLIKRYREERNLKVWILFDLSSSTSALGPNRRDRMAEIAGLITLAALDQRDQVGILFFTDQLEKVILPRRGLTSANLLLRELLALTPQHQGTNWEPAFSYLSKAYPQGGAILFLISDFASPPPLNGLLKLSQRNELIGVFVEETLEKSPPPSGELFFEEAESGKAESVYTGSKKYQATFLEEKKASYQELLHLFGEARGSLFSLSPEEEPLAALSSFLKRRRR